MTKKVLIGKYQAKGSGNETIATWFKKRVDMRFSVDKLKMPTV